MQNTKTLSLAATTRGQTIELAQMLLQAYMGSKIGNLYLDPEENFLCQDLTDLVRMNLYGKRLGINVKIPGKIPRYWRSLSVIARQQLAIDAVASFRSTC